MVSDESHGLGRINEGRFVLGTTIYVVRECSWLSELLHLPERQLSHFGPPVGPETSPMISDHVSTPFPESGCGLFLQSGVFVKSAL